MTTKNITIDKYGIHNRKDYHVSEGKWILWWYDGTKLHEGNSKNDKERMDYAVLNSTIRFIFGREYDNDKLIKFNKK